ncbi:FG-GAP-like repeat-containing protein [Pseudalkalibacillus sp. A8]|uniref:FG-GAP-like repeat-containing protein n=1 Tax=Pseudalkalibacillus sp. A8 TaxID=3382641 RepID=UPI0038B6646C
MPVELLDRKTGDVNGDGIQDVVFLTGTLPFPESPFRENITLWIQDGHSGRFYDLPLKTLMGYQPSLFLGDLTGDKVNDILISMFSGGSGGYTYNYVYSFVHNNPRILFNYEVFNDLYHYKVEYLDGFKVKVTALETGNTFIIDIQYKGAEYLAELYDQIGILKKPVEGSVNALGGLYPVDFQGNGVYDLLAYQRIIGLYNADGLGQLNTYLRWNDHSFHPYNQTIQIY